jgi:hypothetical protein
VFPTEHSSYYTVSSGTAVLPSEHSGYDSAFRNRSCHSPNTVVVTVPSGTVLSPLDTVTYTHCRQELIVLPSEHSSHYTVPSGTDRVTL